MRSRAFAVSLLAVIAGCSAETSNRYTHPTLIAVSFKHPDVQTAFAVCGREVYASGIVIDGKLETDRETLRLRYIADLVKANPLDGPRRTVETFVYPPYRAAYMGLEDRVTACMKAKGFEKTVL